MKRDGKTTRERLVVDVVVTDYRLKAQMTVVQADCGSEAAFSKHADCCTVGHVISPRISLPARRRLYARVSRRSWSATVARVPRRMAAFSDSPASKPRNFLFFDTTFPGRTAISLRRSAFSPRAAGLLRLLNHGAMIRMRREYLRADCVVLTGVEGEDPAPAPRRTVRLRRHPRDRRRSTALRFLTFAASLSLITKALCAQVPSGSEHQNPLKTMTLEQLGDIEVTTISKKPEGGWDAPAAMYIISQEDIQGSGATNIPEALRLAPGVEVARMASGKYAIGIRGFNSRLSRIVLVLIDGRTAVQHIHGGHLLGNPGRADERHRPHRSHPRARRAIWGPNAVNGVINIITKNTKETEGALGTARGGDVNSTV